jgi:hypothetical protein
VDWDSYGPREFYARARSFLIDRWRISGPEFDALAMAGAVRISDLWRELCYHGATADKPDRVFDYVFPGYTDRKEQARVSAVNANSYEIFLGWAGKSNGS